MQKNQEQVANIAEEVLKDPILLRKICNRIYELMNEELRNQQERTANYGRYR